MSFQFHPMRNRPSFKLGGIMLLVVTLLFCVVPAVAEEAVSTTPDVKSAPCKDLKPFKNIDELLYQLYINLDSDCLFTMPVAELEKIWGIKILSTETLKPGQNYNDIRNSAVFRGKPYESEKDAFYVEIPRHNISKASSIRISMTEEYRKRYGSLFPYGNYPKLIPDPLKKKRRQAVSLHISGPVEPGKPDYRYSSPSKYRDNNRFIYYWVNSEQTHMIFFEGVTGSVTGITMLNRVLPAFTTNTAK